MYLVNLDKAGKVIMDDAIHAVEEFRNVLNTKSLGEKGMLWVSLYCDYDSVFRHFTESERRVKKIKKLLTQLKNTKHCSSTL